MQTDRKLAIAVAVGASLLGILAMAWLAPDTAAPIEPPPTARAEPAPSPSARSIPVAPRPRPRPAPVVATAPKLVPRDSGGHPTEEFGTPPEPPEPIQLDRDRLYDADLGGLTHATMARRDDLAACWRDFGGADLPGRFTLKISVSDGGDDAGKVDAEVVNGEPTLELSDCLNEVMSDAAFPSPGPGAVSMVVPIPLTSR